MCTDVLLMFVTKYACTDNRTNYYIQRGFFFCFSFHNNKKKDMKRLEFLRKRIYGLNEKCTENNFYIWYLLITTSPNQANNNLSRISSYHRKTPELIFCLSPSNYPSDLISCRSPRLQHQRLQRAYWHTLKEMVYRCLILKSEQNEAMINS